MSPHNAFHGPENISSQSVQSFKIEISINLTQWGFLINGNIKALSSSRNMVKCVTSLGYHYMATALHVQLPNPREFQPLHSGIFVKVLGSTVVASGVQ